MIVNNLVNDIIRAYTEGKNVPWWSSGETWESIRLPDGYEKPPKEEFETKLQQLIEEHKWKDFRQERNKRLAGCDWITLKAYSTQKVVPKVWRDYMQALRDIPSNTEDPENPIWPVAPQ